MTQTAKTYGDALYELARDEGLSEEILGELTMAAQLMNENPQYPELLSLPSVPKEERCQILDSSFKGRVHTYLLSFMKILVENGTIRQLPGCSDEFRRRYYEDNGIVAVTAITAVKLSDKLTEELKNKLTSVTGKKIVLTEKVDPTLLGGVRLEMDGKRYDGTVRSRLDEIEKVLSNTVL
jgi:F-type H+-transporting ATPase subunit delta